MQVLCLTSCQSRTRSSPDIKLILSKGREVLLFLQHSKGPAHDIWGDYILVAICDLKIFENILVIILQRYTVYPRVNLQDRHRGAILQAINNAKKKNLTITAIQTDWYLVRCFRVVSSLSLSYLVWLRSST